MSEEIKNPAAAPHEQPFNPFLGLDIGERWGRELGSIDSRLTRVENDILEVKHDLKALDAKTDKMVVAINRLDERLIALSEGRKSDHTLLIGLWVTVLAGIIVQFFLK